MNFKIYWQIFDFRKIEEIIKKERINASFLSVAVNIAVAIIIYLFWFYLIFQPLMTRFSSQNLNEIFGSGSRFALGEAVSFALFIVLYGLLHLIAHLFGARGKFTELAYFLSAFLPAWIIIDDFMLLGTLGSLFSFLVLIYTLFLTYKIMKILYPQLSSGKIIVTILISEAIATGISLIL